MKTEIGSIMEAKKTFLRLPEISEYTVNFATGRQLCPLFYKEQIEDFPDEPWTWSDMLLVKEKYGFRPHLVRFHAIMANNKKKQKACVKKH